MCAFQLQAGTDYVIYFYFFGETGGFFCYIYEPKLGAGA